MAAGTAALPAKGLAQSQSQKMAAETAALPWDFSVQAAYERANLHAPRFGQALDLVCQHELTPDLGAPMRTVRGQLKLIRFGLRYLKPVWHLVLLSFLIVIPVTMIETLTPLIQALIVDRALPERNWNLFWIAAVAMVSLKVMFWNGWFLQIPNTINAFITWYIGLNIKVRLRRHFYLHMHRLSLRFFERRPIGEHKYRNFSDIDELTGLITGHLPNLLRQVLTFVYFMMLAGWIIGREMTLIVLLYLIPYYICFHVLFSIVRKIDREQRARAQRIDATLQEGVAGIKTVKAFARQRHEMRKYINRHVFLYRLVTGRAWLGQFNSLLLGGGWSDGLLAWIKKIMINLRIYYLVIFKGLPLGVSQATFSYLEQVTGPITTIIALINVIRVAMIPAERVFETLSVEPMVADRAGARRAPALAGALAFSDVVFSYEPGRPVLKGMEFTLEPGESVGVVGPSGAG
jgi:ABC-type multidrug transport system fused ATPase/permease subunit